MSLASATGANLSTLNAALKETWTSDRLVEQIYQGTPFLARLKKLKQTTASKQALTPVHVGRNWGYTALPPGGGTLNDPGGQGITQAAWKYANHHQQIRIEGEAIDGTSSDLLSVAQVVNLEVEGALTDLNRQITRQVFQGTADNNDYGGTFLRCAVSTTTTTVNVQATDLANAVTRGWLPAGPTSNLVNGPFVQAGSSADGDSAFANRQVTGVDTTNNQIVISGANVSTAATDYVSFVGSRSVTDGSSAELNSLRNIVRTTGSLGGINPATYPAWTAAGADTTAQALVLPLMYQQNQKVQQATGKQATYVLTGLKQRDAFYTQVQAQVRFGGDTGLGVGNVEAISFNGMNVYADPDCLPTDMFFLTIEDLFLISNGDPYWVDKVEGGSGPLRWIQGTDAFGSKLTYRVQLGAQRRNSHAKLQGLT